MKIKKIRVHTLMSITVILSLTMGCRKTDQTSQVQMSDKIPSQRLLAVSSVQATYFNHPGILNTSESLNYIGNEVDANPNGSRGIAYNQLKSYTDTVAMSNAYEAIVNVAGGTTPPGEKHFKTDAILSYAYALRWAKTGDAQWSNKAIQILNGWAGAFKSFNVSDGTETRQGALEASWAAPSFVAAAEILRFYICRNQTKSNWQDADIVKFTSFIDNLNRNYIDKVVNTYHMTNNWAVSAGYAKMAIGVFEDSQNLYNSGLTIIKNVIPQVMAADGSMSGETCEHRDYLHSQYSLTGLSFAANIAAIQNDPSIYSASNSRLLSGYKFLAGIIKGGTGPCGARWDKSQILAGVDIADRRYNTSETNFIQALEAPHGPNKNLCFLGFTTYTHYGVYL